MLVPLLCRPLLRLGMARWRKASEACEVQERQEAVACRRKWTLRQWWRRVSTFEIDT